VSARRTPLFIALVALVPALIAADRWAAAASDGERPPSVLVVTAHPDDESIFAGLIYAVVHRLGGSVDLAVMTDGAGGFRYASLAEPIYGLRLTDERVARANLPRIRQRELFAAADILGIGSLHFFDQPDLAYTEDARAVLEQQWDAAEVRTRLGGLLERGRYELVVVPLPTAATHGAHQAAAILTLEAVAALPQAERPAILGGASARRGPTEPAFAGQPGFPITRVPPGRPVLVFDRTAKIDLQAGLDSRTIVDWVMAAHKSQGRSQGPTEEELELYSEFAQNDDAAVALAEALFARLARPEPGHASSEIHPPRWYGVCPVDP